MRRLILSALVLVPVLAHGQAAQTSTATAAQSSAAKTTLQAKNTMPAVVPAAKSKAPAAVSASDVLVPVHENVVERSIPDFDTDSNNGSLSYSFDLGSIPTVAPKLVQSVPLTLSLSDMEAQAPEASVVLSMTVDLLGVPRNITVSRSGGAALDKRALDAVRGYRFTPASQNHIPVEAPITIEIKVKKS